MIFGISSWLFWLILLIIFLILEAVTFNMTTVWFAVGCLVAMIMALLGLPIWLQSVSMLVVSAVLLLVFIMIVKPRMSGKAAKGAVPTNADRIIGQEGVVLEMIDPVAGQGLIKVKGQTWSAVSERQTSLPAGAKIQVIAIQGVKAVVIPLE